ncbi:hypothetical protein PITC_043320 [Penicillium italicum]|uniref:Uncharacterized protein n=1 Tax=Penicillium italicum TaxID=40296 RepID=A0A0A2KS40_PENIT|nr:hypothetical protein PITC_043320 [Penicillium italicum]
MPSALTALRKRQNTSEQQIHGMKPEVSLWNTPDRLHALNTCGALPDMAKESSDREDTYRKNFPADQADVKTAALTMWSKAGMPAFWMPITNGGELTVPSPLVRRLASDGQTKPMVSTPKMYKRTNG